MIWSLTIHPTRPNVMYAGSAPIALYRSLDGGDTWHRLRNAISPTHCERPAAGAAISRCVGRQVIVVIGTDRQCGHLIGLSRRSAATQDIVELHDVVRRSADSVS
jgi:hypothetical protein